MTKFLYTTLTLFSTLFLFQTSTAQDYRYDFTSGSEAYIPLVNAEQVTEDDEDWVDIEFEIEVEFGFTVPVLGIPCDGAFNFLSPDLLLGNGFDQDDDDALLPFMFPNGFQFQNRARISGNMPSRVYTLTEGTPGNRIFKMEYNNVGFEREESLSGTMDMFTNEQVWIYEATGCIEYRYGPTSITDTDIIYDGATGMTAGLFYGTGTQIFSDMYTYYIGVQGDPASPETSEEENGTGDAPTLTGHPAEGVLYTFCPEEPLSTNNLADQLDWQIFPNPVENTLTLNWQEAAEANYIIFGMEGTLIQSGQLNNGQQKIDLSDLSSGCFGVKIQTAEGFAVKRFVKN